jgi:hypothetical protein
LPLRRLTLGLVRRFSVVASLPLANPLVAPTLRLLRLLPDADEEALVDLEEIDVSGSDAGSGLDELFPQGVGRPNHRQRTVTLRFRSTVPAKLARRSDQAHLRGLVAEVAPKLLNCPPVDGTGAAKQPDGETQINAAFSLPRRQQQPFSRALRHLELPKTQRLKHLDEGLVECLDVQLDQSSPQLASDAAPGILGRRSNGAVYRLEGLNRNGAWSPRQQRSATFDGNAQRGGKNRLHFGGCRIAARLLEADLAALLGKEELRSAPAVDSTLIFFQEQGQDELGVRLGAAEVAIAHQLSDLGRLERLGRAA